MTEPRSDGELEARLRALYREEVERAASDLRAAPISSPMTRAPRSSVLAAWFSTVAIAAVLLLAVALGAGAPRSPGLGAGATESAPTPTGAPAATPGPPIETLVLQDGIPTTIDGQAVLTGAAISNAISNSTDDTPLLIGGWFPAGGSYTYCMALKPGPASCTPYVLHLTKGSEEAVFVYPATAETDIMSYMTTQPVVMRVHTHDPRCAGLPNLPGCEERPVLEAIVWLGSRS
jgi:hypothetical protein